LTEPGPRIRNSMPPTNSESEDVTLAQSPNGSSDAANEFPSIAGYEITELLGRGGMAVVYKAHQQSLRRDVAIKMVLAGAHASPEDMARFRIEAESVAQLHHPHIVQIFEVGQQDGCPYYSLELVTGGSLFDKLHCVELTANEAAQLIEKLARAIGFAHQRGIVHRDLKPGNILLTADGQPKITDFGLAKRMDHAMTYSVTGIVLGTPSYMSPEQASGSREVGPAADIYALGTILYELLTGQPPFRADTALNTMLRVRSEDPTPPRRLVPAVPRDLETICLKCLEKDPGRRYASAEQLADDLQRFQHGEAIVARPPNWLGRFDRWARLRPALAATFVALSVFYLIHLLLLALRTPGEGGSFHWFVTALIASWATAAAGFQWLVSRTRWSTAATFAWAALDVLMLTLFLLQGDGPHSAMLPGYLLLIAGTVLRLRIALVWFVTGLCLLSYAGLLLQAAWSRPYFSVAPKNWILFVLSLLVLGLIQHLLLRRVLGAITREQ
jgi:serine/threonine-protein kinase